MSSNVFEELADIAGFDPLRLSGANRYETALEVAEENGNSGTVLLATGENFPDALAAGPLAEWEDAPILLNNGDMVRPDVAEFLLDPANGITDVIIVGGTAAIPTSVETQLTDLARTRRRAPCGLQPGSDRCRDRRLPRRRLQRLGRSGHRRQRQQLR